MYSFFKIGAKIAMRIYCSKNVVNFNTNTSYNYPKIIGANHPNSFFDAIVIAVNYPKPIYFLARGDAFNSPLIAKFLTALHLIPIYRLTEGKNNLGKNEETFKRCIELLKQNQTILIFSEGLCVNEWRLRPLKKGTARLALLAHQEGVPNLRIQPTNLNYSSFTSNPKEVLVNFNSEFGLTKESTAKVSEFYSQFNLQLKQGLENNLVIQLEKKEIHLFENRATITKKVLLALPALLGYLLNRSIYIIFKNIAHKKTKNTVFYDSVLFGLLLLFYPLIVLIIAAVTGIIFNFYVAMLVFISFPISAWTYSQYKAI
ncbi:MAG: 1-acyl-sn-glycerol-3-phosphate acyltransferase [Flavobacteriaceae bacterium]|nr:1-acyl-sn-glycerol-3-phosphate acyltransferase [Flavobacteriaceae bacterium]